MKNEMKVERRGKGRRSPKLRLNVTQELIQAAIAKDSNHCMIAEAVKNAYPPARGVAVDLATIRFSDRNKRERYTYLTPRIAQAALVNFDQERKPEPFSFLLRGAQVTSIRVDKRKSGEDIRPSSKAQKQATKKASLVFRHGRTGGNVPDRIGGKTPPLQKSADNLPFSRRRAFGLRALEL
jgi:hypothetical protein